MKCLNCGQETKRNLNKYCSNKCQCDFQYKQYILNWQNDTESGMRGGYGISNHIKRYLFEKYDNKCGLCGWHEINPFTNNIPLEIEHIDGDYENNKEENLILICPNCHSLTATYKGANKGSGRKERSKYNL